MPHSKNIHILVVCAVRWFLAACSKSMTNQASITAKDARAVLSLSKFYWHAVLQRHRIGSTALTARQRQRKKAYRLRRLRRLRRLHWQQCFDTLHVSVFY